MNIAVLCSVCSQLYSLPLFTTVPILALPFRAQETDEEDVPFTKNLRVFFKMVRPLDALD